MVQPVYYMQTDSRWKNQNYSAPGEKKTIGSSGCGIVCSAMVIATLKDKNVTPVDTANWSMAHGYKALNQGTYYTYFVPQFKEYGIECKRLNTSNLYGKSSSTAHTEALNALKNGDWVIAVMGKGNWTSSGHYILLYGYENGYVYINDSASKASKRVKNTWTLFAKQVKYMWTIKVPDSLKNSNNPSTSSNNSSANSNTYTKKQCVKDIQSAIGGLTVDGVCGEKTLSKLPVISKTKNSRHKIVKYLQKYLNAIGYNCGTPDGAFGNKSHNAIVNFQRNNGCVADGVIGKNTWKKLFGM